TTVAAYFAKATKAKKAMVVKKATKGILRFLRLLIWLAIRSHSSPQAMNGEEWCAILGSNQ
ncbi:MAG: hypothetical protein V4727_13735, partial [Verrucomicrobiota bacterium]